MGTPHTFLTALGILFLFRLYFDLRSPIPGSDSDKIWISMSCVVEIMIQSINFILLNDTFVSSLSHFFFPRTDGKLRPGLENRATSTQVLLVSGLSEWIGLTRKPTSHICADAFGIAVCTEMSLRNKTN